MGQLLSKGYTKRLKEVKNLGVRGHKYIPFEQNDGGFYFLFPSEHFAIFERNKANTCLKLHSVSF